MAIFGDGAMAMTDGLCPEERSDSELLGETERSVSGASGGERPSCRLWLAVVLVLVGVQAIFGGNAVVVKAALHSHADPVVFSLIRDVGGAAILLSGCAATRQLVTPSSEHLGWFVLMGVLGVYIGQMFLNVALQYITPVNAALVNASQAVLTLLLAALFRIEPLRLDTRAGLVKAAGVVAVTGGALYSVLGSARETDSSASVAAQPAWGDLILGNFLLVVQCTGGALFQLIQKHVLSLPASYPPAAVAGFSYTFGGMAVALVIPICRLDAAAWQFSASAGWCLLYSIVLTSATSYAALAWANKHSSPALITAFFPLQMVFTAIFQLIFLGVAPTRAQLAGGVLIIVGLSAATAGQMMTSVQAAPASRRARRV